jgi:hypothetical protein
MYGVQEFPILIRKQQRLLPTLMGSWLRGSSPRRHRHYIHDPSLGKQLGKLSVQVPNSVR